MNLYEVLGISIGADALTIKVAYRLLAQHLHPDKESGDKEKFQELQEAYAVLSDPERRKQYDETGATAQAPTRQTLAVAMIAGLVTKVSQHLLEKQGDADMLAYMRRDLHAGLEAGQQAQIELVKAIQSRQQSLNRLRFLGTGSDLLRELLHSNIAELDSRMAHNEDQMHVVRDALDILVDYEYELDAPDFGASSWVAAGMLQG